jgi:hypothetical protein
LSPATIACMLALLCGELPKAATQWTGRMVASRRRHQLEHRAAHLVGPSPASTPRQAFKKSNGTAFAAKVEDIVVLYMNPHAYAVVVSIDEKSQIQALDRTQPGLPIKPGCCGTMAHD